MIKCKLNKLIILWRKHSLMRRAKNSFIILKILKLKNSKGQICKGLTRYLRSKKLKTSQKLDLDLKKLEITFKKIFRMI